MKQKRFGAVGVILMLVLVGGALFWWANSRTNEDPLWFMRSFNAEATWIAVYWEGKTHMLFPGDAGYDPIMDTFAKGLGHWEAYDNKIELADEDLATYRDDGCFLEFHYNKHVQVHTRFPYPKVKTFFVPLTGAHAESCRVFAGLNDSPRTGALTMREGNFDDLCEAIESSLSVQFTNEP